MESFTTSVRLLLSLSTLALLASSNSTNTIINSKGVSDTVLKKLHSVDSPEGPLQGNNIFFAFPDFIRYENSKENSEREISVNQSSAQNDKSDLIVESYLLNSTIGVDNIANADNHFNASNANANKNVGGLHRFNRFHKKRLSENFTGTRKYIQGNASEKGNVSDAHFLPILTQKYSQEGHGLTNHSENTVFDGVSRNASNIHFTEAIVTNSFELHYSEDENISSNTFLNVSFSEIAEVSNSDADPLWKSVLIVIVKLFIMGGIIVVAIMGNILVIVSISLNRKLRSLANHFLISLAVADIMVAVCAMSFNASVQVSGRWMFGAIICDLWNSFDVYFSTVSILHLCCISMDRYYAILKPLEYPIYMTRKVVFCMITCSWLLPAVISFVPIFLGWYATANHLENRALDPSSCPFEVNTAYALISSGLSFWFPCTVMLVMYFRIFQEARKQEAAIMSRTNSTCNMNNTRRGVANSISIRHFLSCIRSIRCRVKRHTPENMDANLQLHHLPALAEASIKSRGNNKSCATQSRPSVTESVISMTRCSMGSSPCLCSLSDKEIFQDVSNTLPSDKNRRVSLPLHDQAKTITTTVEQNTTALHQQNNYDKIYEADEHIQINHAPGQSSGVMLSPVSSQFSTNGGQNLVSPPPSICNRGRSYCSASRMATPEGSSRAVGHAPMMKREHKAARTLGIIMGAFILCWLPFFTWYVASNICGEACATPDPVVTLLFWIGYFNSTLNPFIYAYFRADFREAFRKTLRKMKFPCFQTPSIY